MKKIVNIVLLMSVIVMIFSAFYQVHADIGAKPSITVEIDNINTSNYIVDLFVYEENPDMDDVINGFGGNGLTEEQNEYLNSLNYDGWVSESTRSYLVFSDCLGNSDYSNYFTYFDTPTIYRVYIMNCDTKEEKISDVIERKEFTSTVKIDFNDMSVKTGLATAEGIVGKVIDILGWVVPALITFLIEFVVYKNMFNIKNKFNTWVIFVTNIITNLVLQGVERVTYVSLFAFIIAEVVIILIECFVYKELLKEIESKKVTKYAVIANIISGLLTFIPSVALLSMGIGETLKTLILHIM